MIVLVALKRFNATVHKAKGSEEQKVAIAKRSFPGMIATGWDLCTFTGKKTVTRSLPVADLLDVMNRGGGIEGVVRHILKMV